MRKYLCIFLIIFLAGQVQAQITVTVDITKDAHICDFSTCIDNNFGTYVNISAMAWTNGGVPFIERGLLEVDLGEIPANAIITEAKLYLYGTDHNPLTRSNASYL